MKKKFRNMLEQTKDGLKVDIQHQYLTLLMIEIHKTNASIHITSTNGTFMEFRLLDYFQGETCYFDDEEYQKLITAIQAQISIAEARRTILLSESGVKILEKHA